MTECQTPVFCYSLLDRDKSLVFLSFTSSLISLKEKNELFRII